MASFDFLGLRLVLLHADTSIASVSKSGQPLTYFIDKDQLGAIRDRERNIEPFAKQVSATYCAIWHAAILEVQPILPMRIEV